MWVKPYFNNDKLIEQDISNDYKYYSTDYLKILIKGNSIYPKPFIWGEGSNIIIVRPNDPNITYLKLDPKYMANYEGGHIFNVQQVGINLFTIMFTYNILEGIYMGQHTSKLLLCWGDITTHILYVKKEYSLDSNSYLCDFHSYIFKNLNHTYLIGINTNYEFIIQEKLNNKIVWEIELNQYLDKYLIRHGSEGIHINSLYELNSNQLVVSCRNLGLICINKSTNTLDWVISHTTTSNFNGTPPTLQHYLEPISASKLQFAVFNNNWPSNSIPICDILNNKQIPDELITNRPSSILQIYDVCSNAITDYKLPVLATPRCGSIMYIKDNIFDIFYGYSLYNSNGIAYTLGQVDEIDLTNNQVIFSMKFNKYPYNIRRGL